MYAFIGGSPTAGKSHLANKFISQSNYDILHVKTDDIRRSLSNDPSLSKWVKFFSNQDELQYWKETTPTEHVKFFLMQSKALWSEILNVINIKMESNEHVIFEGISIIPELARKYLNFTGFYIIPPNKETIYTRLLAHSRWGKTNDLKRLESQAFFNGYNKFFINSARKYGYKVFKDINEASTELAKIFKVQL